jgi:hypothetical protein
MSRNAHPNLNTCTNNVSKRSPKPIHLHQQQVNFFVAIRTMWSVAGYLLRKDALSSLSPVFKPQSEAAKDLGWNAFVTLTWVIAPHTT